MWQVYVVMFIVVVVVAILWVSGITSMHDEHPDYKGNELFGFDFDDKEEEKNKKNIKKDQDL